MLIMGINVLFSLFPNMTGISISFIKFVPVLTSSCGRDQNTTAPCKQVQTFQSEVFHVKII